MFRVDTPLVALSVTVEDDAVTAVRFAASTTPPTTAAEHRVARELDDYTAGRTRVFTVPIRLAGPPFDRAVWTALLAIPYGETRTYGEIARSVGSPGGARAVGGAVHRNPIPVIVPCHRVVAAGGRLGGFAGGVALKRRLLDLETCCHPALLR